MARVGKIRKVTPEAHAQNLLNELVRYDNEVSNAHYEMGRILSAIEHGQLYDVLGFDSLAHLVDENLSFQSGTARTYINTYRKFKQLGYKKEEALEAIQTYSFTNMAIYLARATSKVSKRTLKQHIAQIRKRQLNFFFSKPEEYDRAVEALTTLGCTVDEGGRLANSSGALLLMIELAEQAADARSQGKLKSAAA